MRTTQVAGVPSHAARGTRHSVLLLGDSIRIGYQPSVATALADVADVWGPEDNGADTVHTLAHLDVWLAGYAPTLVHFNCGLHDLKHNGGAAVTAIPLAAYTTNLARIVATLRERTGAAVLFATTTPVNDAWHARRTAPFDRYRRDVDAFNAAARAVCRDLAVPVTDLYTAVTDAGRDTIMLPDGTHYTDAGYRLLGATVANAIWEVPSAEC